MTLKEKAKEVNPERVIASGIGGVRGCPSQFEFLDRKVELCNSHSGNINELCTRCWNQEFKESEKVMTKSELKTGMRVETNEIENNLYIVLKDCKTYSDDESELIFCQGKDYLSGDKYSDELTQADKDFTINRIYDIPSMDNLLDGNQKGKVLWERKAPLDVTMEEVNAKFGQPVRIVEKK